jgi:hypothetical protein
MTQDVRDEIVARLCKRIAGVMKAVLDVIPDDDRRIEIIAHLIEARRLLGDRDSSSED